MKYLGLILMNTQCLLPLPALLPASFSKKGSEVYVTDSELHLTATGEFFYRALTERRITTYFRVTDMAWHKFIERALQYLNAPVKIHFS